MRSATSWLVVACVVVGLGTNPCRAIKMSVDSRPRCVTEDFWEPQRVRGTFKWVNPATSEVVVEARDYVEDRVLFSSGKESDSFDITARHMKFCFTQKPKLPCVGWRQTGQCNPHGPREPEADKDCASIIPSGASGFCECKHKIKRDGRLVDDTKKYFFTCDHDPVSCNDVCTDEVRRAAVVFDFAVGGAAVQTESLATTEHVGAAQQEVDSVRAVLGQALSDIKGSIETEQEHSAAIERGNSLVVWMHVVTLVMFALSMAVQLGLFLKMFRKQNLI